MKQIYTEEDRYIVAKNKVKKIKGFYGHLGSYMIINIFWSIVFIYGLMKGNNVTLFEALQNFGVYSVWLSWGIGLFFHWLGVFGFINLFSKKWEEEKIKELMKEEEEKQERFARI